MVLMSLIISPLYSIAFAVKYVIDAFMPTLSIYATAAFINSALAAFNREAAVSAVYRPVAALIGIMLYDRLIDVIMDLLECGRKIRFREKLAPQMLEKRVRLEYRHIEDPKTADLINRVCPQFEDNVWGMYTRVL